MTVPPEELLYVKMLPGRPAHSVHMAFSPVTVIRPHDETLTRLTLGVIHRVRTPEMKEETPPNLGGKVRRESGE